MNGFVAVTDFGWYERLSRDRDPRDANFWRPSAKPLNLTPGTPFFFKLKNPHNAICGFGYFANFSVLPDWLAWEAFDDANGVSDLSSMRKRLQGLRDGASIKSDPQGSIGCSLIAEARFFAPTAWVAPPRDWGRTTQVGARYDLDEGEGLRIMTECLQRVAPNAEEPIAARGHSVREPEVRYGAPTLHTPRLGQGIFRVQVLDAYDRACAVTGEHSLPVLEAAHIKAFARGGANDVSNGLLLRSDLHRLFDHGYVTVAGDGKFVVSKRLKEDFENGRTYYPLHGSAISLPKALSARPASAAIEWHRENVFLG